MEKTSDPALLYLMGMSYVPAGTAPIQTAPINLENLRLAATPGQLEEGQRRTEAFVPIRE